VGWVCSGVTTNHVTVGRRNLQLDSPAEEKICRESLRSQVLTRQGFALADGDAVCSNKIRF
jgi:hypothetical protein